MKPVFTEANVSEPANWIEIDGRLSYLEDELDDQRSLRTGSSVAITIEFLKGGFNETNLSINRCKPILFDRVRQDGARSNYSLLYTDIYSSNLAEYNKKMRNYPGKETLTYGIRYKPVDLVERTALPMAGYGVELALKRTDYIVIDDRNGSVESSGSAKPISDKEEDNSLRPLTATELRDLGEKTASYVMDSKNPMQRLIDVVGDFPKYSSEIASYEASQDLKSEHEANREAFLPKGYNVIWMNGLQVDPREVDAFNLVDFVRRERGIVNGMRQLGFSATEAISLLSHPVIARSIVHDKPQRYNFRDDVEGGNVIIWMNDIEKDNRYSQWPTQVEAVCTQSY